MDLSSATLEEMLAPLRDNESRPGTTNGSWNISHGYDASALLEPSEFNIMRQPAFAAVVLTLYVIVSVFGTLGNILVVVTIAKTRQLWNATNIFIANLALADILVCVFDLPLNAYYQLTDDWVFGKALCHVIPSAFAVVVYASTLSLTMIAIDRFILIVFPLKTRMSIGQALVMVAVICVVSIAVASPIAIFADYQEVNVPELNIHWRFCGEAWPNHEHRRLYTILTVVMQYFAPLLLIAILYSCIFRKVNERTKNIRAGQNCRRTKTIKMLVAVVTIFGLTWTPFQIFSLLTEFCPAWIRGPYYKFADSILRVLAMSSSCINPVLYGLLNDNYRNAFLSIVRGPQPRRKPTKSKNKTKSNWPRKSRARIRNQEEQKLVSSSERQVHTRTAEQHAIALLSVDGSEIDTSDGVQAGHCTQTSHLMPVYRDPPDCIMAGSQAALPDL